MAQETPSREDFLSLSEDHRTQINDAFHVFDLNKRGRLDYQEFRFALRAVGFDMSKQETYPYLVRYGLPPVNWDHSEECTPPWREFNLAVFQGIVGTLVAHRDPKEELRRAYALFDTSGKGMITIEDLRRVMTEIGQSIEENELKSMVAEFDSDGKGGVSEDEFLKLMLSNKRKRET